MARGEHETDVNLEELRQRLAGHAALVLMAASGVMMWLNWYRSLTQAFPHGPFFSAAAMFALCWWVRRLMTGHPAWARRLLVWCLTAALLAALVLVPAPWLPFLGLPLAFVAAMLVQGAGFVSGGLVAVLAAWLTRHGLRTYPSPEVYIVLGMCVVLAWLVTRTFYTALSWAWTTRQRADELLELARDRQAELNRALKSLDLSNSLLRRTQHELVAARRQAEQARLMKEQFAANVSHELRTPLGLILGFSELMYLSSEVYGDMEWPPTLRRDVYQIYRSSRHLLDMINDILDLSRFEMVGFTWDKEVTPLEPLLHDAAQMAADLFRGRPVRLELDIASDLPALEIDRTRVRQVMLNLLSNAARVTESGAVRVQARRVGGEIAISVSDTGPGIPADQLEHIFDEFYQVDRSLHRKHGGAGLGLAISKGFVEAHGGRIWVESREGEGATFTFTLPIPGEGPAVSRLRVERPLQPLPSEARPCILAVDRDPSVATFIQRHLEGHEVVPVQDAGRLEEEVKLYHPQAIVWNVQPGGFRGNGTDPATPVPVIECTLPSQSWLADNLSVKACLTKPVTTEQLLNEIARLGEVRDILIVDDDRDFCQLVERMLASSRGAYRIRRAYSGPDGLQATRAQRPDLVLLDLVMPGLDGFQVLEELRADEDLARVPVVLLTATSVAEDILSLRGSQMLIHRSDGLRPVEVLRCIQALVGVLQPRYDERSAPADLTPHPTGAVPPGPHPG